MFFLARVRAGRSSLCIGLGFRSRRERNVRKGGGFLFFGCHASKHSRPNFWIKSETHQREKEERRNGERERDLVYFVSVFSFVG